MIPQRSGRSHGRHDHPKIIKKSAESKAIRGKNQPTLHIDTNSLEQSQKSTNTKSITKAGRQDSPSKKHVTSNKESIPHDRATPDTHGERRSSPSTNKYGRSPSSTNKHGRSSQELPPKRHTSYKMVDPNSPTGDPRVNEFPTSQRKLKEHHKTDGSYRNNTKNSQKQSSQSPRKLDRAPSASYKDSKKDIKKKYNPSNTDVESNSHRNADPIETSQYAKDGNSKPLKATNSVKGVPNVEQDRSPAKKKSENRTARRNQSPDGKNESLGSMQKSRAARSKKRMDVQEVKGVENVDEWD